MSKAAKINLILLCICVFLFLIAWFQPGLYQHQSKTFTSIKANEIHTIVIQRQGLEEIKLLKKEGQWFLMEPEQALANTLRVDTIIALAEKRSYLQFEVKNKDLQRYALTKPKVSVWLNNEHYVIGSKHPHKEQRYAMHIDAASDNNIVHLIDDKIYYQLRSNLKTFILQKK